MNGMDDSIRNSTETYVELEVASDKEDIPALFREFSVPCDKAIRVGELGKLLIPSRVNRCSISSRFPKHRPLAEHLASIRQQMAAFSSLLRTWSESFSVKLLVAMYARSSRLRIRLDEETIRVLAQAGAKVDLDLYCLFRADDVREQTGPPPTVVWTGIAQKTNDSGVQPGDTCLADDTKAPTSATSKERVLTERCHACLTAFSSSDDLPDLFERFQLPYDDCGRKGEFSRGGFPSDLAWCSVLARVPERVELEEQCDALTRRLGPHRETFKELSEQHRVILEAVIFSDYTPGTHLSRDNIRMLADFNASVFLDIYCSYEPEEDFPPG